MVFRVEKTRDYTVMSNYHLRDKNLSLKAKGLLSWMLSNDDDWDYTLAGIVACCKEGETTVNTALRELQQYGYVVVMKQKPDKTNNRIHYDYNVYERPQGVENQGVESLALESQGVENQAQRNTKERNTNITNTKKRNTKEDNKSTSNFLKHSKQEIKLDAIVVDYNTICTNLPKLRAFTDKRKKALERLYKKYGIDSIKEVFEIANNSDFLTGNNDRGWRADFDFMMREDKFIAILEGKYSGKKKSNRNKFGETDLEKSGYSGKEKLHAIRSF